MQSSRSPLSITTVQVPPWTDKNSELTSLCKPTASLNCCSRSSLLCQVLVILELDRKSGEESAVLSSTQLDHISTYIDILTHWNARINLTAIRDEEEIVTRHFGESLFAARCLFPEGSGSEAGKSRVRVADLGSGAGFPGIPIKLWAPSIQLTLIESNHKKATFLREVCRALIFTDVDIRNVRGEGVGQTYDTVALRAVENFAQALRIAAGLMTPQ